MYTVIMASTKSQRVNLRVAARDDEAFRRAAASRGETLSEFLVLSGRERAERVLADRVDFELDNERWAAFDAALEQPPRDNPAVAALLRRRRPR